MIQQIPDEEFNASGPIICKGHQSLGQCGLLENRSYLVGLYKQKNHDMKIHQFLPEIGKPTGHPEGFNDSGCCCSTFEFANESQ